MTLQAAVLAEAVSLIWQRNGGGDYNEVGQWIENASINRPIRGTIQPVPSKLLQDLPEGIRLQAQHLVWSLEPVAVDDFIVFRDRRHRVLKVWDRPEGGFTRSVIGMHNE